MKKLFQFLRTFDFNNANAHLWVFKRSASEKKFRTKYVQTDDSLNSQLKLFAIAETKRITEFSPYSYISQTNENGCLSIIESDTNFQYLKAQVDALESENRVSAVKDLKGVHGHIVKFTLEETTVYAVKHSTATWKTSYAKKFTNLIFLNGELTGVQDNSFSIERNFDFYVVEGTIFISNKRGFESIMQHKTSYERAFSTLTTTPDFSNLFSDLSPLIEHVGTNSIHLRRMATIDERGIYRQPDFITKLRSVNKIRNWGLNFDPLTNKIIVCENTAKIILQVLLDHRLMSEVTDNNYEVPDATLI